jgi:dihydrofolate reductase
MLGLRRHLRCLRGLGHQVGPASLYVRHVDHATSTARRSSDAEIIEQAVTLDGQISTPQDWLPTRWAGEFEQLSKDLLFSVDALLYGRVSYENHAEVWPTLEEAFGDYAVRMNTIPKHVASRTLTEVKWNATLLGGGVVDAVRKLKEQPGGDILKIGTGGSISRTLLEHRLVEEYLFWLNRRTSSVPAVCARRRALFPVIAGSGARLYDGIETTDFDLIDVKRLDNGILGLTSVPTTF